MSKATKNETLFTADFAGEGVSNNTMEVEASEDGLWIDCAVLVPWDWIIQARLAVERNTSEQDAL